MPITRSGLRDWFDLTEIDDSDNEDEAQGCNRVRLVRRAIVASPVTPIGTRTGTSVQERDPGGSSGPKTKRNVAEDVNAELQGNNQIEARGRKATAMDRAEKELHRCGSVVCQPIGSSTTAKRPSDEDGVEIVGESHRGRNPRIDFPHRREDCGNFDFSTDPQRFCPQCFCYICDVRASECSEWTFAREKGQPHCFAHHGNKASRLKRRSVQIRKTTLRPRRQLQAPFRLLNSDPESRPESRPESLPSRSSRVETTNGEASRPSPDHVLMVPPTTQIPAKETVPASSSDTVTATPQNNMSPRRRKQSLLRSPSNRNNETNQDTRKSIRWTVEENRILLESYIRFGSRSWSSCIPKVLVGRKSKAISNHWHLVVKKKVEKYLKAKHGNPNIPVVDEKGRLLIEKEDIEGCLHALESRWSFTKETDNQSTVFANRLNHANSSERDVRKAPPGIAAQERRCLPQCSTTVINGAKRKRSVSSKTTEKSVPAPDSGLPFSSHTRHRNTEAKKRKQSGTQSLHKTRSSLVSTSQTTATATFGTLGPYWRGEPTKYAGVPYETSIAITRSSKKKPSTPAMTSSNGESRLSGSTKEGITLGTNRADHFSGNPACSVEEDTSTLSIAIDSKSASTTQSKRVTGFKRTVHHALRSEIQTVILKGTVSYDADSRKYFIRGMWHNPLSDPLLSQQFELTHSLRNEDDPNIAKSMNGEYAGYFVITNRCATIGGKTQCRNKVIFESDVQLNFTLRKDDGILLMSGSGTNDFGAFRITGRGTPCGDQRHVYQISLEKRYGPQLGMNFEKETEGHKTECTPSASNTTTKLKCVYSGCPIQSIDGGWPVGWTEKVFQRQNGASKGKLDRYWYSPGKQLKFRSIISVQRFLSCVKSPIKMKKIEENC